MTHLQDKDLKRFLYELPAIIGRAQDGESNAIVTLLSRYYDMKVSNIPIDPRLRGYLFKAVSNLSKAEFERISKRLVTSKLITMPELILEILPGLTIAAKKRIVKKISRNTNDSNRNGRPVKSYDDESIATRVRERGMRRFNSVRQSPRFLGVHAAVCNLFNLGRHLVRAQHYRNLRTSAFTQWSRAEA